MWNTAKDAVSDFAKGIADRFKNFFGIKSPSRLMMEYGADITAGLQIGMEEEIPEIPIPEFSDAPLARGTAGGIGQVNFNPQIIIRIEGNANGEDIKRKLEAYLPGLMDEFFELLAVRMG